MRQDFDGQIASIEPIIASSTHSLSDIITMASIVQDEASNTHDRDMIAGILWRRLAAGIPLQADPTLVYSTGKNDSQLTIADLVSTSPYNTYARKGLPPTPIGSPSLDSIIATAEATTSPYLSLPRRQTRRDVLRENLGAAAAQRASVFGHVTQREYTLVDGKDRLRRPLRRR